MDFLETLKDLEPLGQCYYVTTRGWAFGFVTCNERFMCPLCSGSRPDSPGYDESGLRKQLSTPGRTWQHLCNQINKAVIWRFVSGGSDMERHDAELIIIASLVLGFWLHIDVAQLTEDAWINAAKALWEQVAASRKLALSTSRSSWKETKFWGHHSFCYYWVLSPTLQRQTGAAFLYSWISVSLSPSILFPLWCLGGHWGGRVVEIFILFLFKISILLFFFFFE